MRNKSGMVVLGGLLAVFIFSSTAFADTDIQERISTATVGGITVTTGTAVRVDNVFRNGQRSAITNRVGILVENHNATYFAICSFDSSFSTAATSINNFGGSIRALDRKYIGMYQNVTYYCQCEDGAGANGCAFTTEQYVKP